MTRDLDIGVVIRLVSTCAAPNMLALHNVCVTLHGAECIIQHLTGRVSSRVSIMLMMHLVLIQSRLENLYGSSHDPHSAIIECMLYRLQQAFAWSMVQLQS